MEKIDKSDEEWRKQLTPEQYRVMREKGTERPFTGEYDKSKEKGMYVCAACGNPLFSSDTLAELLPAALERQRAHRRGRQHVHETHGSPVQPVRRPSGPRLR